MEHGPLGPAYVGVVLVIDGLDAIDLHLERRGVRRVDGPGDDVPADPDLLAACVGRHADHIARVNVALQHRASGVHGGVAPRSDVQAGGAGRGRIVRDLAAGHLDGRANLVRDVTLHDLAIHDGLAGELADHRAVRVLADTLVADDVSDGADRDALAVVQPRVQLVARVLARVVDNLVHKADERAEVRALIHEAQDGLRQGVVDGVTIQRDDAVADRDAGGQRLEPLRDGDGHVEEALEIHVRAGRCGLLDCLEVRVRAVCTQKLGAAGDEDADVLALSGAEQCVRVLGHVGYAPFV